MSRFANRFPRVAALLSSISSSTAAPPAGQRDDDDDERQPERGARSGAGAQVDQAELQAAFEADAGKMVSDERSRWATVLRSDEGKANVAGAVGLLDRSDMSAADVCATLKEMGPAAKPAGTRESDEDDDERGADRGAGGRERQIGKARDRLRSDANVDKGTGGAGAGKDGTGTGGDELAQARERRDANRQRRNEQAQSRAGSAGRGARGRDSNRK